MEKLSTRTMQAARYAGAKAAANRSALRLAVDERGNARDHRRHEDKPLVGRQPAPVRVLQVAAAGGTFEPAARRTIRQPGSALRAHVGHCHIAFPLVPPTRPTLRLPLPRRNLDRLSVNPDFA